MVCKSVPCRGQAASRATMPFYRISDFASHQFIIPHMKGSLRVSEVCSFLYDIKPLSDYRANSTPRPAAYGPKAEQACRTFRFERQASDVEDVLSVSCFGPSCSVSRTRIPRNGASSVCPFQKALPDFFEHSAWLELSSKT